MPVTLDSVTLVVMAVDNCNLHCRYCSTPNDSGQEVPVEALEKCVSGLQRVFGRICVGLSGGEPTMHSRFGDLVETLTRCGAEFYVVTNGLLIDAVLPVLSRHTASLSHVMFSLEAADREHNDRIRGKDSFDAVLRGLGLCREAGIRTSLGCALNKANLGQVDALSRLAETQMVLDGVYLWPAFPTKALVSDGLLLSAGDREYLSRKVTDGGLKNVVVFGDVLRFDQAYRECAPFGLRQFTLNPDGRLSLCCNLTLYRGETGRADEIGSVLDEEFTGLIEAHIDKVRDYQKALFRDMAGGAIQGLCNYPCFHCQRHHGKLDWLQA